MRKGITVASLILIALLASALVWGPGMVNTRGGGDSPFLLQRTHQMVENLRAGVFPVRWMPDGAYGLGYAFFSYYAPLPYYLAGLFALLGLDLLTAIKLVQTLGFVAAALAMVGWMNRVTENRWAAWLAAVAYTVAPYHLVNVYVRGDSLSEFYAFIFYPLILWAMEKILNPKIQDPKVASRFSSLAPRSSLCWVWLALAYAGLILSHILSAMIFSPFVLVYLLILVLRSPAERRRILLFGLWGLAFGLLLTAGFWVPVLAERDVIQTGVLTEGYFHYEGHFRTADLVQQHFFFNYEIDPNADTPFAMGLAQAVFAVCGGALLLLRGLKRLAKTRGEFVLFGMLLSTVMITPLSRWLWEVLPLLSTIQFPWRFLSIQALFTAAATAALVPDNIDIRLSQSALRNLPSIYIPLFAAVLLILSAIFPLHPDRLPIGPNDVTAERLQLYELFAGNIGTTIRYEYLYHAVVPRPYTSNALIEPEAPPQAIPLDGGIAGAALEMRAPTRQTWRVWGEGGQIAFPLLYWPGWGARVDGEPVEVWPVEGSGYLALSVPPGEHRVQLRLGSTPVRTASGIVSLVSGLGLLLIVIQTRIKKFKNQNQKPKKIIRYWIFGFGFLVFGFLLFKFLPPASFATDSDLTMDFIQMPYLHHNPQGVDFEGRVRLMGYELSAETLAPGEILTVTLDCENIEDEVTALVQLVSPAAVRFEVAPLSETTLSLSPGFQPSPAVLYLPDTAPRGIYLLQVRFLGPEGELGMRTDGGRSGGTVTLRPIRVPHGPALPVDLPVLAPFGPAIHLYSAAVTQIAPDRLAVQLDWSAAHPVGANYGISLRLLNVQEEVVAAMDTQPGYGFLPTSLWPVGELVTDQYILEFPADLPAEDGYHLGVVLYQIPTFATVGQARIGDFALPVEGRFEMQRPPRSFSLPVLEHPLVVDFDDQIRLAGYALEREEEALQLTLWWQALQAPQADYTVFVHLYDPAAGANAAQQDGMPRGGAYPTSWWAPGEVVSETVTLPLTDVPEGAYELALGLYDWNVTRLPAVDAQGERVLDDRVVVPLVIGGGP